MSKMELGLRWLRDLVDEAIKLWQEYELANPITAPLVQPVSRETVTTPMAYNPVVPTSDNVDTTNVNNSGVLTAQELFARRKG